jgi:hypothetical protein
MDGIDIVVAENSGFVSIAADQNRDVHLPAFGKDPCRLVGNDPVIDDGIKAELSVLAPGLQNLHATNANHRAGSWGHAGPKLIALRLPVHFFIGCGGRQRRSPTGAVA